MSDLGTIGLNEEIFEIIHIRLGDGKILFEVCIGGPRRATRTTGYVLYDADGVVVVSDFDQVTDMPTLSRVDRVMLTLSFVVNNNRTTSAREMKAAP